ncbi:MAG: porin [Alphaproteobacteria bacterium]|nr:porin [Alphaproteobacteria bacterium]
MFRTTHLLLATTLIPFAAAAAAQDDAGKIAALEARVAALESAKSDPMTFGTGSGTTLDFYGYAKLDLIYDFGYELGDTTFVLNSIDAGSLTGDYFNATVRQTRLGFRTTTQTDLGELGTQVEIDFYGADQIEPRLRHATATLGGLRVGQYWTQFMPISSYPSTLDFQGFAGIPFARQEQVAYTYEMPNSLSVTGSIEESNGDSDDPVLIAALAYDTDPLLLRASALTGTVKTTGGSADVYGINLSTTAQLWNGASVDAAYTYGEGINSYMVFGGDDLDGNNDPIQMQAAYIGLTQAVGEKLTLRAIYGWRENDTGMGADSTETLTTAHLNAQYQLLDNVSVGAEYFHGTRDTFGGASYDVDRIQTSVQISF